MIKQAAMAGAIVLTLGLTACGGAGDCSNEEYAKKVGEVNAKITELAATDSEKANEITKKVTEIAEAQAKKVDVAAACKAYDGILASLAAK